MLFLLISYGTLFIFNLFLSCYPYAPLIFVIVYHRLINGITISSSLISFVLLTLSL